MIEIDDLAAALHLGDHELISIVGGGGKSTTMFALGRQLPGHRVVTTTTKMGRDQTGGFTPVELRPDDDDLALLAALDRHEAVLLRQRTDGHKSIGVAPETCDRLFRVTDHVIVEADGSRRRPFKAPQPFEPVVPERTTTLLACIGGSALGRVIADQCHRPMRVAAVAGCSPYQRLTPERAARVLLSDRGSRKNCPAGARYVVVACQVDHVAAPFVDELVVELGDRAEIVAVADAQTDATDAEPAR